ncbi:hypothetical protein EDWATA_03237 [Edwardsiella tarda ATCC 23685]|uniref:Uncharacterized protein n=1 Tax=Edwardsiella tarda ATCC 23685 TaxID=500638 RepID=D4F8Y3_EDWTA|nr:hypothetical protein EDWATA_03237 [Edwardsiella tarda ATCC 23685]
MCYIPVKTAAFFDLNQFYSVCHFYHIGNFMFYINLGKNTHN